MSEQIVNIPRDIGERVIVKNGRDYAAPIARIIPNTFKNASDDEKAVHISQGKDSSISISLSSLEAILNWAKGANQ